MPSLTQPFQATPAPARDALIMHEARNLALPFGAAGASSGITIPLPGGEMHVQMSLENVPLEVKYILLPSTAFWLFHLHA